MLLGYFEFLALLFLPGLAVMELFRLSGEFSFVERLGLAFGLSMAVDVLVLAFKASGLSIGSTKLVGISSTDVGLILGASFIVLVIPVMVRRRFEFYTLPTRDDLYVLVLVVALAVLVGVHFSKYPIFPEFQSVDFSSHVRITSDLQAGRASMFPGGILYYGVHLLMSSALALSGDLALEATQYAMGILTALSPLLVYTAVGSLSGSKRAGLVTALLYVSTGFIWFGSVFNSGLYSNFYGILSILLLFSLVPVTLKQPRRTGVWVALVLAVGSGYLSHYSYVTVIPALLALPVVVLLAERKLDLPSLGVAAVVVVPAVVAFSLRPDLVSLLVQFVQAQGGGNISGDTSLSGYFSFWPVLRYAFVEVADDLGALVALLLAIFGVYLSLRSKNPLLLMLVVWLLAMLVVAPFTEMAWRFSYMTLLPMLIFASLGFDWLVPAPSDRAFRQRSKMKLKADYTRYRQGALVVVFLLLFAGSWTWQLLADAASNGSPNNQTQQGVLAAMGWMNSNAPSGSLVVSVTDSDYNYYSLVYGKASGYDPLASPDRVVQASGTATVPTYVVLTTVGTIATPPAAENPFNLYPNDTRFKLQYNQSGVLIFELPPQK